MCSPRPEFDRIESRLSALPTFSDESLVTRRRRENVLAYLAANQLGPAQYELDQLVRRLKSRYSNSASSQ
jgi:hypothetical protein